jgi:citrate lyase subunit beta/citryl-CoA lyase
MALADICVMGQMMMDEPNRMAVNDPIPEAAAALRSILFVPGTRPELFAKAKASGADALVLDLEDSVPPAVKDKARTHVAAILAEWSDRLTFIRINHPSRGSLDEDLSVLASHPRQAIMVPKVDAPDELAELDRRLTAFERGAGLAPQTISLFIVVESALSLHNLFSSLRAAPRVRGTGLASAEEGDLLIDLGGQWTPAGEALAYARGKFVCDARAAGANWLFDGAFMALTDETALEVEAMRARTLGFSGKIAIHPRQVPAINRVFSPTEQEVERAGRLLAAFSRAQAEGLGAVRFEGMMIDYANAKRAQRILALAAADAQRDAAAPDKGA